MSVSTPTEAPVLQLPLHDQQLMLAFVDRRHPEYARMLEHWHFCEQTYEGGREWFRKNIHKYIKEGVTEFGERLSRSYRFNHTREVTNLVTKYIFKEGIIRNTEDAPDALTAFWKCATTSGASMDELMKRVSDKSSVAGRTWVVVDNNIEQADSKASEAELSGRIYAYLISQQDMLDFSLDDTGQFRWVLYQLPHRDDADPIASRGAVVPRYMLWTQDEWVLLEQRIKTESSTSTVLSMIPSGSPVSEAIESVVALANRKPEDRREIVLIDRGVNELSPVIPIVPINHIEGEEPYSPPGLVDEIAYLDRTVANYLSNLDAIIQDQTFSQLVMPAQNLLPGEDGHQALIDSGTKRIFTYDGEAGSAPQYISPDAAQSGVIISVIKMIIGEIYHSVGMAGERTKQDNAGGIDNSSGVAKAYDFERMNALLCAKADQLARAETRIADLVCLWAGKAKPEETLIKYPESYDVRGLPDEFEIAQNLALLEAPASLRRQQMTVMLDKIFPRLAKSIRDKIITEMKDWPIDPMEQMQDVMQMQADMSGNIKGSIKATSQPGGVAPAAPAPGGNKVGLAGPTGKGVSKQGQAGTK